MLKLIWFDVFPMDKIWQAWTYILEMKRPPNQPKPSCSPAPQPFWWSTMLSPADVYRARHWARRAILSTRPQVNTLTSVAQWERPSARPVGFKRALLPWVFFFTQPLSGHVTKTLHVSSASRIFRGQTSCISDDFRWLKHMTAMVLYTPIFVWLAFGD